MSGCFKITHFSSVFPYLSSFPMHFRALVIFLHKVILRFNVFSQKICDRKLTLLRDDLATDLFDLEDDYYNSNYK
jgi:hypothetical protein